jgi:hypothetical protein
MISYHGSPSRKCNDIVHLHIELDLGTETYRVIKRCRCGHMREVKSEPFVMFVDAESELKMMEAAGL